MDMQQFSNIAISAATKYLDRMKTTGKGKSIIPIRKIHLKKSHEYRLFLAQKAPYIESLELKIYSISFPCCNLSDSYKILSYNEKKLYVDIAVNNELNHILPHISPDHVFLESDMTFLIQAVLKWYKKWGNRLVFPCLPKIKPNPACFSEQASPEQLSSIRDSLNNPISYVWGAPGTGKTKLVLSGIIYQYIQQKKHVLIMAPTNNALEQSLRGILEIMGEEGIPLERVIRLGHATSEFANDFPSVCVAGQISTFLSSLSQQINDLQSQKAEQIQYQKIISCKKEFDDFTSDYQTYLERSSDIDSRFDSENTALKHAQSLLLLCNDSCATAYDELSSYTDLLNRQNSYLELKKHFDHFNNIEAQHAKLIQSYTANLRQITADYTANNHMICGTRDALKKAEEAYNRLNSQKKNPWTRIKLACSKSMRELLEVQLNDLHSEISNSKENIDALQTLAADILQQINQLTAQITNEEIAFQNSPDFLNISRRLFHCDLSRGDLSRKFKEELSVYQGLQINNSLESIVNEKAALYKQAQQTVASTLETIKQHKNTLKEISAQHDQLQQNQDAYRQFFHHLASDIIVPSETYEDFVQTFQYLLDPFENFVIDDEIDKKIEQKQRQYDSIMQNMNSIIDERCVIACTVDYATLHYDEFVTGASKNFEHLFVDEAAYCSLIKAGIFFSFGVPVTLLGDHMQLPPVCEMSKREILASDATHDCFLWDMSAVYFPDLFLENFDIACLFQAYCLSSEPSFSNISVSFLKQTFRFDKRLADVLEMYVYRGGFWGTAKKNSTITIINAPHVTPGEGNTTSPDEVNAIKWYLSQNNLEDYSILTPYKAQKAALVKALALPPGTISTIHASQGREWDTVIVSVTDSTNKFFMCSTSPNCPGLKLVNTAVSRAKRHLILVMDYRKWKYHRKELLTNIANINTEYIEYKK